MIPLAAIALFAPAPAEAARFAGVYDGGQTEVAAALDLGQDGRFRYQLSYGALDEYAEGRWRVEGDVIVLDDVTLRSNAPAEIAEPMPPRLTIVQDALLLPRYDRTLRFRR